MATGKLGAVGALRAQSGRVTPADVAALLGQTEQRIREWIRTKGMPVIPGASPVQMNWPDVLKWYITSMQSPRRSGPHRIICTGCGTPQ